MPTYEYNCSKCGQFDCFQKITEEALKTCPTCGGPVSRLISATAFHLKGTGWYKTDYASSTNGSGGNGHKTSASSASKHVEAESSTSTTTVSSTEKASGSSDTGSSSSSGSSGSSEK